MILLDALPTKYAVAVVNWNSFKMGSFKEQFSVRMQDGTSFWIGAALNGKKPEYGRVRLEANPNKVAQHTVFQELLAFLVQNSRAMHRTIRRFDLAIDIPAQRYDVFLVKDNRAYIERRHGQEWTQYLGAKSSTPGRVKLYNKTVEAKLDYPLTRLEITIDPATAFDAVSWPVVYKVQTMQIELDEMRVTETERFILNALLQGCGSLDQLGRKTRAKMEQLLERYVTQIVISEQNYKKILSQLSGFITEPKKPALLDSVQPPAPPSAPVPDWVQEAEQAPELPFKSKEEIT